MLLKTSRPENVEVHPPLFWNHGYATVSCCIRLPQHSESSPTSTLELSTEHCWCLVSPQRDVFPLASLGKYFFSILGKGDVTIVMKDNHMHIMLQGLMTPQEVRILQSGCFKHVDMFFFYQDAKLHLFYRHIFTHFFTYNYKFRLYCKAIHIYHCCINNQ